MKNLKLSINTMIQEWNKLVAAYEGLLIDIKGLLETNEILRNSVIDLEALLEIYNKSISLNDSSVRRQIEILISQGIRAIDFSSKRPLVEIVERDIQALALKLQQLEGYKFSSSGVFCRRIEYSVDDFMGFIEAEEKRISSTKAITTTVISSN